MSHHDTENVLNGVSKRLEIYEQVVWPDTVLLLILCWSYSEFHSRFMAAIFIQPSAV